MIFQKKDLKQRHLSQELSRLEGAHMSKGLTAFFKQLGNGHLLVTGIVGNQAQIALRNS